MKKILNLAVLFLTFSCSAQSPIINIENNNYSTDEGVYNKDVNNYLNAFEGNYIYTSGTTSLRVLLIKKTMQYNGKYYEDLIVGEYEYKVNGIVIISSLSNINIIYPNQDLGHNISGNILIKNTSRPVCNDCGVNEKRLLLGFRDQTTSMYGNVLIRKTLQNGQAAIKIYIKGVGPASYAPGTLPPTPFKVPAGEYILIKQ